MEFGSLFTGILALATLGGNLLTLGLLLFFLIRHSIFDGVMGWLGKRTVAIGFLVSAGATIGSLVYSEVIGFPACVLCWVQRIFMYPQMFLFGIALWRKERTIIPYALMLSLLGGVVALYQWAKDMLLLYSHTNVPCPAVAGLPSCDKIYVLEFGYVTIAMIALNAFVLLALVTWAGLRHLKLEATAIAQ